jgi:UPF0716 family protein affecting phage T7 exclusion
VPGRRPVNAARRVVTAVSLPASRPAHVARRDPVGRLRAVPRTPARAPRRPVLTAVYRRRRVLAALLLLNLAELAGVVLVGPGFWTGFAATGMLLAAYVVHLRRRAVRESRRRRARAREAAWLAARQAEVRRHQARRAAARREAQRRMAAQREAVRRTAMGLDRSAYVPAAAVGGSLSYRPLPGRRERAQ